MLIQLLTSMTAIVLFFIQKRRAVTKLCLRSQVKAHSVGPNKYS
jgi:hypothetical protein